MTAAVQRTVSTRGVDLAVFEQGNPDGETVVFVHGWPDTHRLWDGVIARMPEDLHLVSYDTCGNGESTAPAATSRFALDELASDFYAVIDAVSPGERVHIVAHDWGSTQMWEAVCRAGAHERVASFTSISGPNIDEAMRFTKRGFIRPTPRNLWRSLLQVISSAYMWFFISPLSGPFFSAVATPRNWARFVRLLEGTPVEKFTFADTLQHDMRQGVRIYRANIAQRLLRQRPPRVAQLPVQILVNRRDIALRPALYDESGTWARSVVRHDRKTGHWVPYSHPEWIAESVTRFIGAAPVREAA